MKLLPISDRKKIIDYKWTDNYIEVKKEDLGFYQVKGELFDITQNKEYIDNLIKQNKDYLKFHYHYKDTRTVTTGGKFIQTYRIPAIRDGWTIDKNHEGIDGQVEL